MMHQAAGRLGPFLPNRFRQPVGRGGLEVFGNGNTLAADEEFGGWVVRFVEGGDAGEGFLAAAAFDLDGDQGVTSLEHEIDFQVLLAPIADLDAGADCASLDLLRTLSNLWRFAEKAGNFWNGMTTTLGIRRSVELASCWQSWNRRDLRLKSGSRFRIFKAE